MILYAIEYPYKPIIINYDNDKSNNDENNSNNDKNNNNNHRNVFY